MSVNVGNRKLSKIEVLYQACKLNESLQELCLRSFGLYSRNSPLRAKYMQAVKLDDDPEFLEKLIVSKREHIFSLASSVSELVNAANAIFPRTEDQLKLRRSYQDKALAACSMIKTELNEITLAFNVDVNCFKVSVETLNYEIHLIKEWRKSDKSRFSKRCFL